MVRIHDRPLAFLHVPKSAGTSAYLALEAALPAGTPCPRRMDPSMFRRFDAFAASSRGSNEGRWQEGSLPVRVTPITPIE